MVELKHALTPGESINVSYEKGQELQRWVIISMKYIEIGEGG